MKYKSGDPNRVPLPMLLYIDGADTGHMKHMPITQMKVSLGIHSREYRNNEWAWRTLGYVAATSKAKGQAKRNMRQSGHIAGLDGAIEEVDDSDEDPDVSKAEPKVKITQEGTGKAQDFHAMLDVILESFLDLQGRGFKWDLRYRGKTYENIEFVPFVIFIKCDTKEADMLCGSYGSYVGVQQLCRYCQCPNGDTDNPQAAYSYKTVSIVKPLCDDALCHGDHGALDELKKLSQHCIHNATHKLRFSPHLETRGVHGACPFELLHATLLGIFMYARDTIYEKVGPTSKLARFLDAQTQSYGGHFKRQSQRDMPKCNFTQGIREGKLNATEYRGVLLVLTAALVSTQGRKDVLEHEDFDEEELDGWVELLELLLLWEAFLGKSEMTTRDISKLSRWNRYILWMIKKHADRETGMGLRLVKYHAVVHLAHDILAFGVPKEFDTGSNESGHKPTKVAAMLTQKIGSLFDWQTEARLTEFLAIAMAMAEIEGRRLWLYFEKQADPPRKSVPAPQEIITGETTINIFGHKNKPCYSVGTGKAATEPSQVPWCDDLVGFLFGVKQQLAKWTSKETSGGSFQIRSMHKRNGQIYRGHPNFRNSGQWKDWVLVDWGGDEPEPAHVWCFMAVSGLPVSKKKRNKHRERLQNGHTVMRNGVYAVAEIAAWSEKPLNSRLFRRLTMEMASNAAGSRSRRRRFYLISVEQFVGPCCVVPDLGSKNKRDFFQVKNRDNWASLFQQIMYDEAIPQAYHDDPAGLKFRKRPSQIRIERREEEKRQRGEQDKQQARKRKRRTKSG